MDRRVVDMIRRLARVLFLSLFCALQVRRSFVLGALQGKVEVSRSSDDGKEVWGYSEVRKGAHMFWWLFYSTHPSGGGSRPLIIWLQGGPGLSSSGVGNLALLGPLDENLQPRKDTWIKEANVLFVDNPIDVGFSYLDNGTLRAQNGSEIGLDLLNMLDSVTQHLPILKRLPIYIFGQSYGGKMAANLAYQLQKAIERNDILLNFKGVAFGNAWISPRDSVINWAPLMLHMSIIDQFEFEQIDKAAKDLVDEITTCGPFCETSREKWLNLLRSPPSIDVNSYNLLQYNTVPYFKESIIPIQMGGVIRRKLGIIPDHVKWQSPSSLVHSTAVANDFLTHEIDKVDWLLEHNIEVIVYQGQLDIMCPTNGAQDWMNKLKWPEFPTFYNKSREQMMPPWGHQPGGHQPEMFVKAHKHLKFYYVLKSGHAVPRNTPAAALRMVRHILKNYGSAEALHSHSSSPQISIFLIIFVQTLTLYRMTMSLKSPIS